MLQKIKYNLSQEDINMIGETIIDETYIGGWVNKHLSYKWDYMRKKGFVLPTQKKYTKTQILRASSDYKQHVIAMIDSEGKTKLLHLPNPITKECIKYVLRRENGITSLVCDESKLYENCGLPIETNNHSKHQWLTATGKSSNAVENRFSWTKRKIKYNTHTSEKYLQLYLNQFAWQNNVKYMSSTYRDCTSITTAVCGPNVTSMYSTYSNCYNLTGSPVCGNNVTDMYYTYYNCLCNAPKRHSCFVNGYSKWSNFSCYW